MKSFLAVLVVWISFVGANAQTAPCGPKPAVKALLATAGILGQGILNAPRNAVHPNNLAWELPIGGTTGVLIAKADLPLANRIQSQDLQNVSSRWSNIGLATEIGGTALAWTAGCLTHHPKVAETGFTALAAVASSGLLDLGLKAAFNRQYPYTPNSTGKFWGGGKSFPSGHSASSFAVAAVVAHRYPHNKWIKWGTFAFAAGVSLSRYPAKKHFASDILVGSTLGWVVGTYLADHPRP